MHELSIAESLLEIIVDESKKHGLERVNKIKLQIGEFAAVVPESLTFCFEMVSRDTVASGALIEIETRWHCGSMRRCAIFLLRFKTRYFYAPGAVSRLWSCSAGGSFP